MLQRYLLHPHRDKENIELFGCTQGSDSIRYLPSDSLLPALPQRRSLFLPYAGYAIDGYRITHDDSARSVETRSIVRNINYKEQLALRLRERHTVHKIRRVFTMWRRHCFRFIFLRRQLLKCHMLKFLSRRFRGWWVVSRREALLRKCIRRYWRRHRNVRYALWKLDTRWRMMRERLWKLGFRHMLIHLAFQRRLNMRWMRIRTMYQRLISALILQRAQRRHSKRRHYWANRVIKHYFMCWYGVRLIEERKRNERQRITMELETSDVLVERGLTYLKNLLQEEVGQELHSLYLKAIKVILRKTNETLGDIQPMFPSRREMPGIGAMWTTNGKAMYILKHRCEVEIRKLARDKFRLFQPPLYECKRCHCVCFLRCEIRHHRMHCSYDEGVDDVPQYVAWRLAQPVAEGALAPLRKHYAKQLKTAQNSKRESNQEYLRHLCSFRNLEHTPSKPLKHARSVGSAMRSLSLADTTRVPRGYKERSTAGGGISRSSAASGLTASRMQSHAASTRSGRFGDAGQMSCGDSVYSSVVSVDLSTTAGFQNSPHFAMQGQGQGLRKSTGLGDTSSTIVDSRVGVERGLNRASSYRVKSERLLANAVFSDGAVKSVKSRMQQDFDEEEDDDDPPDARGKSKAAGASSKSTAEGEHDEDVDDWF